MNLVRLKRMVISPDLLCQIFTTGTAWKAESGVPIDAELRGFTIDPSTQHLNMFIESDTFDEIDTDAEIAPIVHTLFKKL